MSLISPGLWVVGTPIGNPGDLSPRAREVLENADIILAEDTRRAGLAFRRWGVAAHGFMSCHEHNEASRIETVLEMVHAGKSVALISDAGTPLLSDPGYNLVRALRREQLPVFAVPGPFAGAVALSASGVAPYPFCFLGFLPRGASEREKMFETYGALPATLVFYERKDRLPETVDIARKILGRRDLCLARELTKEHEEFMLLRLEDIDSLPEKLLGEFTVIIGPPEEVLRSPREEVEALVREESTLGGPPKQVAQRVRARASGWSAKEIYSLLTSK